MSAGQFGLLKTRRFLPLFLVQFLGAFNGNVFKNALVILMTYITASRAGMNPQMLVTMAAGVFILPFFLFSATAGQLADKYEKGRLVRIIKLAEIIIMLFAAWSFYLGNIYVQLAVLFAIGTQSTFFGPLKYALLPDHLREDELMAGNGLIEAGTFLAILTGTLLGGLLILKDGGIAGISCIIIAIAFIGWWASHYIPKTVPPQPKLHINPNIFQETWRIIGYARANRDVFLSIMGISWFWLVGATFLSQFPTFTSNVIGGNEEVVTLFLIMFSVGVGVGSMLCNKLLKGEVSASYVPLGALGITLFTADIYHASKLLPVHEGALIGAMQYLGNMDYLRINIDMVMIAICAGIYIVPLYAIMQSRSAPEFRARIIASNNVLNALFMVASAIASVLMFNHGFSVTEVFLSIALLNGLVAVYICKLLPDRVLRGVLQFIFRLFFRVKIDGLSHVKKAGRPAIIIANHTSFLDAALIAAFIPEKLTFAINTQQANKWYIKPLLSLVEAFPIDPTNPLATRALIEKAKSGATIVIFPEGRLTVTGSLMKVYEGSGMIADKSGAELLPVRIDGAQYSCFSRLKGKVHIHWFPRIHMTVLEARRCEVPAELRGRNRRRVAGEKLYDIMSDMMFESSDYRRTLFQALVEARAIHGGKHVIVEDVNRTPLDYDTLITRSRVLGRVMSRLSARQARVGLLLPNTTGTIVSFFALQSVGRVPAMLNYSMGVQNILAAINVAAITEVYSSRRFVELAKLGGMIDSLIDAGVKVYYLEDVATCIGLVDKIIGVCQRGSHTHTEPDDAAVVLFTSGSEGMPKGVVLSHANIMANCNQLAARVDFGPKDIVFNALPVFHSFGLTGGTLLPILHGIRTFFYPSPLHYRIVPELVYDTNATIMFGTDTFLSGYARFAHPYDFYSVRYVFAGAEKLKDETRRLWSEKFGVRVFEGYGATETSPVLATNTPMQSKPGTVGRFMPGISCRLEDVPGVEDGKRLYVRGPNVMKGYLLADRPGHIVPPKDGWYDTGDIIAMDEAGYVTIKGRAKRFAKIGGEMVSLAAVEAYLAALWPSQHHAVISIPDDKKGEQLILVTDYEKASRDAIIRHVRQQGISELSIPRDIKIVRSVPLLATGKVDYPAVRAIIAEG
jgi:acyl-[acyl-carrier-protein]-phospholipid O-acyltransferase/long-chain-fatty-acid--[acyl-carrier-protein] ligase